MRKMATISVVDRIEPIENADSICVYVIRGWKIVDKIGKFRVGDRVVMCEIDSWIPNHLAPFLSKGASPRMFEGVLGERLRTVKLRGQVSQGLLLHTTDRMDGLEIGSDVSEMLGIVKYEPPVPAQLGGVVIGMFPSFVPKTDQERIQNLSKEFDEWRASDEVFEVTEKLDGSSMTVYCRDGKVGVCSRNLDLKEDENNTFWKVAHTQRIVEAIRLLADELGPVALQGELIGEGIQNNRYKVRGQEFRLFDIYFIADETRPGGYCPYGFRNRIAIKYGIKSVPFLTAVKLGKEYTSIEDILAAAEGKSELAQVEREGLVFKCLDKPEVSFKAISNKFLLKNGD